MKLEYTGLKTDGERAFKELTGIEWMPGAVHDVDPKHAEEMLKHPTIWRVAADDASVKGLQAKKPSEAPPALPEWAKKGIDLGATDEQLEAVGQAGGPQTEAGAALWKDATGTEWQVAAPARDKHPEPQPVKKPAAKKVPAKKAAKAKAK